MLTKHEKRNILALTKYCLKHMKTTYLTFFLFMFVLLFIETFAQFFAMDQDSERLYVFYKITNGLWLFVGCILGVAVFELQKVKNQPYLQAFPYSNKTLVISQLFTQVILTLMTFGLMTILNLLQYGVFLGIQATTDSIIMLEPLHIGYLLAGFIVNFCYSLLCISLVNICIISVTRFGYVGKLVISMILAIIFFVIEQDTTLLFRIVNVYWEEPSLGLLLLKLIVSISVLTIPVVYLGSGKKKFQYSSKRIQYTSNITLGVFATLVLMISLAKIQGMVDYGMNADIPLQDIELLDIHHPDVTTFRIKDVDRSNIIINKNNVLETAEDTVINFTNAELKDNEVALYVADIEGKKAASMYKNIHFQSEITSKGDSIVVKIAYDQGKTLMNLNAYRILDNLKAFQNLTDGQTNDMMLYRNFSPTLVVYTKERLE